MNKKTETQGAGAPGEQEGEGQALLEKIIDEGRWKDPANRALARDIVGELARQVLEGEIVVSKDTEAMINARIAQIDALISKQLNEILHNPDFQKLEASWRGLHYLVNQSETGTMLKVRVLNVSKKELVKDLEKAVEFDQSALFKKVYEEEYGMFGGAPFGALIGDYEFGKHPEDISLLEKISNVAAASHAPFISAGNAELLNLESFTQLDQPRDLAKIFDTMEYAKWKSFRESEDSR
ncbi:MAG: type VI secretion system contractile sheath large subunit, partial [Acidobacteria bacterium]